MSRLPFELFLALRYLRPKRTFVSVITLISIIGVTLGVAVLIIVISVMTGFDRQLREKILGFQAHLKISMTRSNMRDYQQVMRVVASNSDVKGVAPFVLGPVLLEAKTTEGDTRVLAPYVRGIDPNLENWTADQIVAVKGGIIDSLTWWEDTLAATPKERDRDGKPYAARAASLQLFLTDEVLSWLGKRRQQLMHRPLVREHAFGESLDPHKLERLGRYEVHLDRKLERMLAMLYRLKELRPHSDEG